MAKDDFLKKEFHIGTEFGKRFNIPENIKFEYDGETGCVANDIAVRMAEKWENFVVEQIVAEAVDMGISDLTVLNKTAIMDALRKRIPVKPIRANRIIKINGELFLDDDNEYWKCPICTQYDVPLLEKQEYCHCCGQALDWGKENDNDY